MNQWIVVVLIAAALVLGCAIYIRLRWHRSPRAYKAMAAVAACTFLADALVGGGVLHLATAQRAEVMESPHAIGVSSIPEAVASAVAAAAGQPVNAPTSSPRRSSASPTVIRSTSSIRAVSATPFASRASTRRSTARPSGTESSQHLNGLLSGKMVALDCENERSYGRLICKILLTNGQDVCLDQLKAGMAWHYKQYQDEQSLSDREAYAAAECAAMKARTGLWSDPHSVQPQDFRHATNSPLLFDANGCRMSSASASGPVVGNARTHIFEWQGCPYYSAISPNNEVPFPNLQAAEAAGYRNAHNCP